MFSMKGIWIVHPSSKVHEKCHGCGACEFSQPMVAIVDLASITTQFAAWNFRSGVYVEEHSSSYTSLSTVYDDVQLAEFGRMNTCG